MINGLSVTCGDCGRNHKNPPTPNCRGCIADSIIAQRELSTPANEIPSAWVGCLGCYNSGRLIGKWIPGNECDDLEAAGLTNSAGACLKCGADEFWVMDHEHFSGLISGECSPMEAYEAAMKLEDVEESEREVLAAWLGNGMEFDLEEMRECYAGEFDSDTDFGWDLAEATGLLSEIPDYVANYFDMEAWSRDLLLGDYWSFSGHYFRNQ